MFPSRNEYFVNIMALLIYLLAGMAFYIPLRQMWGINHLIFLPSIFSYFYWLVLLIIIIITISAKSEHMLRSKIELLHDCLWSKSVFPRLILPVLVAVLGYTFSMKVHLLGDGYTWLANFGSEESYIHKPTELGSIFLIRMMQQFLGDYTESTAYMAFRWISIISGAVFIYNIISVIGKLCSNIKIRILALSSFIFSGSILLFFGYVEFYPLLWAIVSITINLSLLYIRDGRFIFIICISYLLSVLVHFQVLYLLPGFIYLIIYRIRSKIVRTIFYSILATGLLAAAAFIVWLYNTRIDFEVLIVPFFKGRPIDTGYTVFSLSHFLDLYNLLMLVFPGFLILISIWLANGYKKFRDPTSLFLLILSGGSLLFLFLFKTGIPMWRDWDLMSLSLFTPFLLLLYQIDRGKIDFSYRTCTNYILIICFFTVSYLSANLGVTTAEKRYYALLNNKEENGWVIYANYFLLKNNDEKFKEILSERDRRFPGAPLLRAAYGYLEGDYYDRARSLAYDLIKINPYNSSYLQFMGNIHGKYNQFDSAKWYYDRAALLDPYNSGIYNEIGKLSVNQGKYDEAIAAYKTAHELSPEKTFIIEGLGLAYIHRQNYDSALFLADSLFIIDSISSGAHLIRMNIFLRRGDYKSAAENYRAFLKHGHQRSDYLSIKNYYKNLENY